MVEISPIRNEADYRDKLARLGEIFLAEEGTTEGDEREILCALVGTYEDEHYPINPPIDPIASIEFHMDQRNLTLEDLAPCFGSVDKARKVMARKDDITLPMARALHKHLGISAETLLQPVGQEFDRGSDLTPKA